MKGGALALIATLALSACAEPMAQRLSTPSGPIAAVQVYDPGTPSPMPPMRANAEMVEDFLELGFQMESGRAIPQFSRFQGPITLVTRGPMPAVAGRDLERLLGRLRTEAGIDIRQGQTTSPGANTITVEFVPQRQMRAAVPQASCFVVPNITGWQGFLDDRRSPALDWTQVVVRRQVTVFIPADAPPQEIRDCLHEEIAQALGPLNDVYRLTDSVFNDDNFQTTLTGFDMLVLRIWYAPELSPGMTRGEVAARLPALFNRLNPAGRRSAPPLAGPTPRAWTQSVDEALSGAGGGGERRAAALRALSIARSQGWTDARLAISLVLTARLAPRDQGDTALGALLGAADIYRSLPGGEVHGAHMDMQLAVQALATGQYDLALTLTSRALPLARRTENAALEASLAFLRAEALALTGRPDQAERLRLDSLAAARYGFGTEEAARARMDEIARLGLLAQRLVQR